MKRGIALVVALLGVGLTTPGYASDHIDGLKTTVDNSADITDLFTFTSPRDPSKLVLILNVHPVASRSSKFSNAVDYKFRIRPIESAATMKPSSDASKEQWIVCSFTGRLFVSNQQATCTFDFGDSSETLRFDTRGRTYSAGGGAEKNGIRVFAGVRSDPWFLDLAKALKFNAGVAIRSNGINGMHGQNVLSIVVEVDKQRLHGPLLAVTAQTVRK